MRRWSDCRTTWSRVRDDMNLGEAVGEIRGHSCRQMGTDGISEQAALGNVKEDGAR
jgi:hypothetical protein